MLKKIAIAVAGASVLAWASVTTASAMQGVDAEAVANCMIENHSVEAEQSMKDFMIAALQEDAPAANAAAVTMSTIMLQVASEKCGVTMGQLQDPGFQAGLEAYGNYVGQKIMTEAMGKLGLM